MDSEIVHGYPFVHHPCWADCRENLWERIHLPVAGRCNVKCFFCDHALGNSCHSSKPGISSTVMTPSEAIEKLEQEIEVRPRLKIVGISGPGEPLANPETFDVMKRIKALGRKLHFCISTNGVLLPTRVTELLRYNVETISVSISTVRSETARRIYEWASIDGEILTGSLLGEKIVKSQLAGIQQAVRAGIRVKANTILIPSINDNEMKEISHTLCELGVSLQNIVPLVPWADMSYIKKPTTKMIEQAREAGILFLEQFKHCRQCRSDVVGIPGMDSIL